MSESEKQATIEVEGRAAAEVAAAETAGPSARTEVLGRDDSSEEDRPQVEPVPTEAVAGAPPDRGPQGVPVLHSLGWLSPSLGERVGDQENDGAGKAAKLCNHIKEDGVSCGRPALRERQYCYQHLRLRGQQMRMARALAQRQLYRLVLPPLDDMAAVHVAATRVADALAAGLLEPRRAGVLLYALQQASSALRWMARAQALSAEVNPTLSPTEGDNHPNECKTGTRWGPRPGGAPTDIKSVAPFGDRAGVHGEATAQQRLVEEYPEFEAEFGLPAGLDLSQPPHVVFPPAEQAWPSAAAGVGASSTLAYNDPPPSVNRWTKEDIEMEELEKRRDNMSEESYCKQSRKIHDCISKQVQTEMRKEQEAEWQAEADRRNAFEGEKGRLYRNMDDGQRRAYHLGVVTGIETAQRDAEEEARKKRPAAKAVIAG